MPVPPVVMMTSAAVLPASDSVANRSRIVLHEFPPRDVVSRRGQQLNDGGAAGIRGFRARVADRYHRASHGCRGVVPVRWGAHGSSIATGLATDDTGHTDGYNRSFALVPSSPSRSLPSPPFAPLAQLDRASGYEPGGRKFESCRAHQPLRGKTVSPRQQQTVGPKGASVQWMRCLRCLHAFSANVPFSRTSPRKRSSGMRRPSRPSPGRSSSPAR